MFEPVLRTFTDAAPMPRAEVRFTSLAAGTASVTVWRRSEGRSVVVRGALRAVASAAFARVDFEIPFGVPATYWAEMFDAAGVSLGVTGETSTVLHSDDMWVHNPLDPFGGVRADFRGEATRALSRPIPGTVFYPQGATVGKIIAGRRRGLQDVVLDVITDTPEDADKVRSMLGGYDNVTVPVLCFRIGSGHQVRVPRPLFAAVLDLVEQDMNFVWGGNQIAHAMSGSEVSPPSEALFVPLLTRRDINAYYATRAAANADNLTRLDINTRYDLAGFAGGS
jgi:hypothetical protein